MVIHDLKHPVEAAISSLKESLTFLEKQVKTADMLKRNVLKTKSELSEVYTFQ